MQYFLRALFAATVFATTLSCGVVALPKISFSQGVDEATTLSHRGVSLYKQGRYDDAELLFKRSLAILERTRGPNDNDTAAALRNLAGLYLQKGRYTQAEPLMKRSLAIREKTLGPNHSDVATSLNDLAQLYRNQDRFTDAELLMKRSLAIYEKALGPDDPRVAQSLNNLGVFYQGFSLYAEAEPLYKRSLTIRERKLAPNDPNIAESLGNLAALYTYQGRYQEAESLVKRSLTIEEKTLGLDHPTVAVTLNNLSMLYARQSQYQEAEPLIKRSLAIVEKSLGPDHPSVAKTLNNLAGFYVSQKQYLAAEPLYKRSLEIYEKAFGPSHHEVVNSLLNLAQLYGYEGRYSDALPIVKNAIKNSEVTASSALPVLIGAEKADLIDRSESFSDSYAVFQLTTSSDASNAVNKLAQRYAAETGELAALVRKYQDLDVEYDKLNKAIIAAVSKSPNERNPSIEDQIRARIVAVETESKKVRSTLNQMFPNYVALANPQPVTLQITQNVLADDEAVIAFMIGEKGSYAWAVTKTDAFWTEIPTRTKVLDEQIRQLRQSLTFRTDKPYDTALAHKIYTETFGPIATKIAGKKRLSIVANGALTSIPFGLLVVSDSSGKSLKDTDWLIKSFSITVIPSIYSLKTMRVQSSISNAPKAMIAFADPVFSTAARRQAQPQQVALRSLPSLYQGSQIDIKALAELLPQLDGTRKEVQTIAENLGVGSSDIKLGLDATETFVKQASLDQYRIVYFATHGLVSGELAKFSKVKAEPALALTIPDNPTELDDGLLQASEISQLKLSADWVVLSACNTASADSVGAEALSGLARAFLYAGARSLVVSHWDVQDEATSALMSSLFDIAKKQPKLSHGEVLQQAVLKRLSNAKTDDEAHPRLWAPFIVVGEPAKSR